MVEKYCASCGFNKDVDLFRKDKNRYDGLDGMCKSCRNTKARNRYKLNPEPKKQYSRIRSAKIGVKYNKMVYERYKNSGKKRVVDLNRRAKKKEAAGKVTNAVISDLLKESNGKCFYCEEKIIKYHVDHFIPLSKGGSNLKENLRISCPKCNLKKGAKIL